MKPDMPDFLKSIGFLGNSDECYNEAYVVRRAIEDEFGMRWELGDLAPERQVDAIRAWIWFQNATGKHLDPHDDIKTLTRAAAIMRKGGDGWERKLRWVLENDFNRLQFKSGSYD